MKRLFLVLSILVFCSTVYAQNRYALLIGNAKYPSQKPQPNTLNDIADVGKVLTELGYNVTLKSDLNQREMVREINAFINRLSNNKNSEGFFWYAGHGIEVDGENFLMPLDVDVEDDAMIKNTSYSVTTLTRDLDKARNKANVLVLDCCRVPPTGGGTGRGAGDTTRIIKTVPNVPADLLIVYSTKSGFEAIEGDGKRNSPFTEAFLKNMKSTDQIQIMINRVTRDTMELTARRQQPYTSGSIITDEYYSLNPSGARPSPSPQPSNTTLSAKEFYNRGVQFYENGDYEMAVDDFNEAIRIDPKYKEAYNYRGDIYYYKEDYDRAITEYTQAIRIDPNYADAYYNRGWSYSNKKDYDRAISDFSQAIRIDQNNEWLYNARGDVYHNHKQDYDRAISDYSQAIRINTNEEWFYRARGDAYINKREYDRAIADYSQAIRIEPDNGWFYHLRGAVYYNYKQDYDRAIADYTQAIRIDPEVPMYYNNRGNAYIYKSDYDRAIADYTQAIRVDPDYTIAYYGRGNAYYSKNDFNRAIADYEAALKIYPDYAEAREWLENARKQRGY